MLSEEKGIKAIIIMYATLASVIMTVSLNPDFLHSLRGIILTEDYSYLIALYPVSFYILFKVVLEHFRLEGISPVRTLLALTLIPSSLLFASIAISVQDFMITFSYASFLLLFLGVLALFYRSKNISSGLLVTAILFLMTPFPKPFLDITSLKLMKIVVLFLETFGIADVMVRNGLYVIPVHTPDHGVRFLELSPECSGIVSLFTVFSSIPLVLYYDFKSEASKGRKLGYSVLALLVGALLSFMGNVLRISAVIIVGEHYGFNLAMKVFHSTPALIYTALSIGAVLYILEKKIPLPRQGLGGLYQNTFIEGISQYRNKIMASIILVLVFMAIIPLYNLSAVSKVAVSQEVLTFEELAASNTTLEKLFTKTPLEGIKEVPSPKISSAIGILVVKKISGSFEGQPFAGYLEIDVTPGKFHGWWVCLTGQGYNITSVWSQEINGTSVTFIKANKGGNRILLSYFIVSVRIKTDEGVKTYYARLTLITPYTPNTLERAYTKTLKVISLFLSSYKFSGSEESSVSLERILVYIFNKLFLLDMLIALSYVVWRIYAYRLRDLLRHP